MKHANFQVDYRAKSLVYNQVNLVVPGTEVRNQVYNHTDIRVWALVNTRVLHQVNNEVYHELKIPINEVT